MRKLHLTSVVLLSYFRRSGNFCCAFKFILCVLIREGSFKTISGNQNKHQGYEIRHKTLRN